MKKLKLKPNTIRILKSLWSCLLWILFYVALFTAVSVSSYNRGYIKGSTATLKHVEQIIQELGRERICK